MEKSNANTCSIEKIIFPRMLKKLVDRLAAVAKLNAQNGFSASGFFPLCKQKLLDRVLQKL